MQFAIVITIGALRRIPVHRHVVLLTTVASPCVVVGTGRQCTLAAIVISAIACAWLRTAPREA